MQNSQIQQMQGWLDANAGLAGASTNCYAEEATVLENVLPTDLSIDTSASTAGTIQTGVECTPTDTTLKLKWNMFVSEWGGYTVDGCDGVNPKLKLAAGTTYTFDQSDASNWCARNSSSQYQHNARFFARSPSLTPQATTIRYHPVGFAYIAGGAHMECVGGPEGECPELGGEAAGSTLQYYVDGVAVTNDESGFGLDAYEPLFFNSQDNWAEHSPAFKVTLTIPTSAAYTKIYYFCHIHAGMSAEIELTGTAGGNVLNPDTLGMETQASALAIYDHIVADHQQPVSAHDEACGTYDIYAPGSKSSCSNSHFLCGSGAGGAFETCLADIDCKMHHDMAIQVEAGASKFATFARQMIPHHQNAVSMAKSLLKFHTADDYGAVGDPEDDDMAMAVALAHEIINAQNHQIQYMAGWLDSNPHLVKESDNMCYEQPPGAACTGTGGKDECAAGTHCSCGGRHPHHSRHLLFASMGHPMCQCHSD